MGSRLQDLIDRVSGMLGQLRWWVGGPAALIVLVLVGRRIYFGWAVVQETVDRVSPTWILMGIVIASVAVAFLGWNWVSVLSNRGVKVCRLDAMKMYFTANLARYVPGGVWHFAGRTLWLTHQGQGLRTAAESLAIEQGITLITAGVIGFFFIYTIYWKLLVIALVVVSGGGAILFAGVRLARPKFWRNKSVRQLWQKWAGLLMDYSLFWILQGLATLCLAAAIAGEDALTVADYTYLTGVTALSWAAGYVVVIIPGGWGVRELIFMELLSREFSSAIVVLLPVLVRLVQITAEMLCVVVFWVLLGRRKRTS